MDPFDRFEEHPMPALTWGEAVRQIIDAAPPMETDLTFDFTDDIDSDDDPWEVA